MRNRQVPAIFLITLGLVATNVAANAKGGGGGGGCGHGGMGRSCASGSGVSFGSAASGSGSGSGSSTTSGSGVGSGSGVHWGIPNNVGFGRGSGAAFDQNVDITPPPRTNYNYARPFLFSGAEYIGPSGYGTYVQSFTWPKKAKPSSLTTALTNSVRAKEKPSLQHELQHKRK